MASGTIFSKRERPIVFQTFIRSIFSLFEHCVDCLNDVLLISVHNLVRCVLSSCYYKESYFLFNFDSSQQTSVSMSGLLLTH